jgi:uncharacterized iron-regulated membrane protein
MRLGSTNILPTSLRPFWVCVHRYVGLVLASFLIIAGLTGSLLVWYYELDAAVNPWMKVLERTDVKALDPLQIHAVTAERFNDALINKISFHREPQRPWVISLNPRIKPNGEKHALVYDEVYIDPYTGGVLGQRKWGDITQGYTNLIPFIYRLHYQLALGTVGTWTFGIIALLWCLDCFVGAYLTFPVKEKNQNTTFNIQSKKRWLNRWSKAWKIRQNSNAYKLNFDLHRAGSLWTWVMLFVFAWSGVGLNLQVIYDPIMSSVFPMQKVENHLPNLKNSQLKPGIGWIEAETIGKALMKDEASINNFNVIYPQTLIYLSQKALYQYRVKSTLDITDAYGNTTLYFDANTGKFKGLYLPASKASGDTITSWLYALHMAAVWGISYKIFVSVIGIVITMLSVTGVYIWWKKRKARKFVRL